MSIRRGDSSHHVHFAAENFYGTVPSRKLTTDQLFNDKKGCLKNANSDADLVANPYQNMPTRLVDGDTSGKPIHHIDFGKIRPTGMVSTTDITTTKASENYEYSDAWTPIERAEADGPKVHRRTTSDIVNGFAQRANSNSSLNGK